MTEETFDQQARKKPRKGKIALTVGLILLLGGAAASIIAGVSIYDTIVDQSDFQRIVIPGREEIEIRRTGDHNVFLETQSRVDGKVYRMAEQNVEGLEAKLTWADTGEDIPLDSPAGNLTYSFGVYEGKGLFTFETDRTGKAVLEADYPHGQGPQAVLAVGQLSMGTIVGTIIVIVFGVLAALAGLITTIVGLIRFATSG